MIAYYYNLVALILLAFVRLTVCNNRKVKPNFLVEDVAECNGGHILSSSVCVPKFYKKADIPNKPTVINTSLVLKNVRATNDKDMTITADIIFSLYWIDNRIKTAFTETEIQQGRAVLENSSLKHVWHPDIYIYNLSNYHRHTAEGPLGGLSVLSNFYWEEFDGTQFLNDTWIEYWFEAKVSVYCHFYYHQYPMDTQWCQFRMTSSNFGQNIIFKLMEGYNQVQFPIAGDDALNDFDMNITFFDSPGKILPSVLQYWRGN